MHTFTQIEKTSSTRTLRAGLLCCASIALAFAATAGPARAATSTFGSALAAPATLTTAYNLNYAGTDTPVPASPAAPNGIVHTPHVAADTALWNVQVANGAPSAPASGQLLGVSLEGCAQPSPTGAPPLTQIHFQDLAPQPDGSYRVNVTSQAFEAPICGQNGASGTTVTSYAPSDLCVAQGDYIVFNDEGGFDPDEPGAYPAGVPFLVIGAVPSATMDSFIRNNGTGNGATFAPSDTRPFDGFASNAGEELMLQATLGTGPDASPLCPGGTKGRTEASPASPRGGAAHALPLFSLPFQRDGMNSHGFVQVALFCHAASTCTGSLVLSLASSAHRASAHAHGAGAPTIGQASFAVASHHTGKVRVKLSALAQHLLAKTRGSLKVAVSLIAPSSTGAAPRTETIYLRGGRKP